MTTQELTVIVVTCPDKFCRRYRHRIGEVEVARDTPVLRVTNWCGSCRHEHRQELRIGVDRHPV